MTTTLDDEVIALRRANADLRRRLDERTRERDEALQRETATAEVLKVINSSPEDLKPVFEAILEKAHALCGAVTGSLQLYEGEFARAVATRGLPKQFVNLLHHPRRSLRAREAFLRGEPFLQITDLSDPALTGGDPTLAAAHEIAGVRTMLNVPLRKEATLLGVIVAGRPEVRPFSEKEISLLQNFAAQAVIAMENARLITETREALEQQTATAEVLQVINSSPDELAPVFDSILEKAHALCGAAKGSLVAYDGERYRTVASRGLSTAYAKLLRALRRELGPSDSPSERLLRGESLVQIPDLRTENDQISRAAAEIEGARTVLFVPLRKDGALLGYMTACRQEVSPFSEKQIALLQNFAAQAVIAMENARLLTETREALEQQTATAEVLQVINSSPGDLPPVFDAILEKAHTLCGAAHGSLSLYDGERFRAVAINTRSEEFANRLREGSSADSPLLQPLLEGARFVHVPDLAEVDHPGARIAVVLTGAHTALFVPLRKDGLLLGVISAVRLDIRPFSDKEIALVENFAAQAVIAMENARLITETREALEQQRATAEVLQVINSSPGDLAPVFDAMLDKAIRLSEATHSHLFTYDGDLFHLAAARGEPRYIEWQRQAGPVQPYPSSSLAQIKRGQQIVHVADIREEEVYRALPKFREQADLRGVRSEIAVALIKDNILLGAMVVYRQEVRPFTNKQIALLQNFAAQAVIAMENARLITETREALEQQTATAEVLGVINSSPGGLAPVFDAILEKAHRLCGIDFGALQLQEGRKFRSVAARGLAESLAELLRQPFDPVPGSPPSRLFSGERIVHIPDMAELARQREVDERAQAVAKYGFRTGLFVPLRKDADLLGYIVALRREVRPYSQKEIALLQNFAAQAVIAMENARLITETREATAEHTLSSPAWQRRELEQNQKHG